MTIEYENDDIVIINKPAGLAVQDITQWTPAHRLDKQTSGLLALAKNQQSLDFLRNLFKSRDITKEYLALVYGRIEKHGVIDKPLVKIGHEGSSRVRVHESGRKSVTEYWPIQSYRLGVDEFTLVRVRLHTGRTHQIRVHFAHMKHPVMGDDLYGKPNSRILSSILSRQFLHAAKLELKLPDNTWLEVESKLPEDLQKALDKLLEVVN
ncbi:MAG: hypothetical protein A3C85_04055 [Candidatus Doudnabacteria bacterium RIFCSPHIGHO2_02_FULL_48_21]|uniref:Pseudouridine synthase RsuA/RluA-like domain-containing protein n=1 Tax=Candidatus Doudnabacteria bacterium RIFCSPLOWO2_02_FULL_48_13 TaxID=1817845 RepID=A0A1F5QCH1_9BACT|nr:MAG: hypothetical protein A3K05_01940 [Candidatus Doudnabacteria bacterium RIFCSPHIGHO2_01_48_18]OGE79630.1 MAG: hypothetical protein A2668_01550 [Candidatus Doudnabacteria bacterium RIFCSPHIGHO2_01_FULL_48_180]OGE91882.1 MAG: hypothetical protein A3F44_04135 [Candidatus Doudnabacteria bacterium RIFCSPHIGHO2_12_FULL_47_25]OGE93732.1 MAG: hypothetical protein A3C85_04055 [Candidatus Doudnabacteria bacterium RIFCSPHIGHO2_02_FULL_48_21]OGE97960.1 MAG: hypothetical protein A3A83_02250 [Candidatu